jgi:hypothetical protein
MPGAQCTRSLAREVGSKMRTSIHSGGTGNHPAFPHAMVLTAYIALSSESDALLPPSPRGLKVLSSPVELNEPPRDLTRASRRRDHTTSPYADSRPSSPSLRRGMPVPKAQAPTRHVAPKLKRRRKRDTAPSSSRASVRSRRSIRPATPRHAQRCRVHRIPPRVRDDRDTPLVWDETT